MSERQEIARWQMVGLTDDEYRLIVRLLGRDPNDLELGLFGAMWSEHCSYKSSRLHLKKLPSEGSRVLVGPGENAGVLDMGDGYAVVAKIESHNHPSAIEPVQGAATGVGGIIRDIFTMGARPIALLDSLRFGNPGHNRTRFLFDGVVAGIGHYGNCIGLPTVGGEVVFEDCYQGNPLVNAMCVGIMRHEELIRGRAEGKGNPVFLVGARTGRDGIHGASLLASRQFDEAAEEMRPAVQVGDPFMEKLLVEACLELVRSGVVVGVNDLGAAGLTSAASEAATRAGSGLLLDLDRVPCREEGMTPYEIMLSESQERMLVIVRRGSEEDVERVFQRWGLEAARIGEVTDDGRLRLLSGGQVVADVPARLLTEEAPRYDRPFIRPTPDHGLEENGWPDDLSSDRILPVLETLLAAPNIASKRMVYQRYDHQVLTNTVQIPGGDAAVLRLRGTNKGLALTTDGNGRYCFLNPRLGASIAVAEAARNVACTGAIPIGLTNCLNFGNPERPEIMGQFVAAIEGMAEACRYFGIPVTGGNVSFYNESMGENIFPTPIIGMVGLLEDVSRHVPAGFQKAGDRIVLLGESRNEIGGSEFLKLVHGRIQGPIPELDMEREAALQRLLIEASQRGLIHSAHDCSDGGLLVALAESCFLASSGARGLQVDLSSLLGGIRTDALLFGETQSRAIVSCPEVSLDELGRLAAETGVPYWIIGNVETDRFAVRLGDYRIDENPQRLNQIWEEGLKQCLA